MSSSKKNYATKRGIGIGGFNLKLVDILIAVTLLILIVVAFT